MMNLKALGIFRVIAEQADKDAMANWKDDRFVLYTTHTEDEIREFFLTRYRPTPLVSPWNAGSGFLDLGGSQIDEVEHTSNPRLSGYARAVRDSKRILEDHVPEYRKLAEEYTPEYTKINDQMKAAKDAKSKGKLKSLKKDVGAKRKALTQAVAGKKTTLMRSLRDRLDDQLVPWFDSMFVTTPSQTAMGAILGTYGNDGNFDISYNFLECVMEVLSDGSPKNSEILSGSLFGSPAPMSGSSNAYFYPGGYGGANSTCAPDFPVRNFTNKWDYVLCLEGTLFFAGSISRRSNSRKAAFPFTADQTMAGYGTAANEKTRGELWIPIWDHPTTYAELRHVFAEGRAQIGVRQSVTGTDFARALASLGVQRGISGFQRFGIMERKGQAYMCAGLGRYSSSSSSQVNLFTDIDAWLNSIRRARNRPKHIDESLRRIDDLMLKFCTTADESRKRSVLQDILVTIGHAEQAVARSSLRDDVKPLQHLSKEWAVECYDDTPEFRLAAALGSITDTKTQYHIRYNLEPITKKKSRIGWTSNSTRLVWNKSDAITNMTMVLERRCTDASMSKTPSVPLEAKMHASVSDIVMFLNGEPSIDYGKIGNLVHPLSMIRYDADDLPPIQHRLQDSHHVPETYICIKSNISPPWKSKRPEVGFEPSIVGLLKADKTAQAAHIARRRLHISGIGTAVYSSYRGRQAHGQDAARGCGKLLAASLLFPVHKQDIQEMVNSILLTTQSG